MNMSFGLSEHSKEVLTGKYNVVVAISLVKNNKRGNALENVKRKLSEIRFFICRKKFKMSYFLFEKTITILL